MNNFNNNGNPWGNYNMNFGYNRPKMPNPTNPLSKEEMALLKQKAPQFSLAVTQVDALKAICTHRDETGEKLIQNSDGTVTCMICGTTFKPISADLDTVNQIFRAAVDCLETIKIMYMDIPDDVTKAYFQMTPYLEKGPQLYKIANDHYQRYSGSGVMANNYGNNGNVFAMYSALMNPGAMMGMGMPQQAPYGQPYAQPQYGQPMNQPGAAPQNNVPDVTMGMGNTVNPFDVSSPAMNTAQQVTDNKQFSL